MALWQCEKCGQEKEGRCKPRKCPECGDQGQFVKKVDAPAAGGCGAKK
ncbi:MAG: rubredoxin [Deltaproteobacteria bacterium]|nr:rubredoxin [Candidatus Anaeroferrophillacea bacterium]